MLIIIGATIPPTTATPSKVSHNWAAVQLNLIMLPVGITLLVIVSLIACICQCIRKKRVKKQEKELRKQRRNASKNRNGNTDKHHMFSINSAARVTSPIPGTEAARPFSPFASQPPKYKREKQKKKDKLRSPKDRIPESENEDGVDETKMDHATRFPERKKQKQTGEPALDQSKYSEKKRRHSHKKQTSFEKSTKTSSQVDRYNNLNGELKINSADSNGNIIGKERIKWSIPENEAYDKNASLRLPPLASLRLAKTA